MSADENMKNSRMRFLFPQTRIYSDCSRTSLDSSSAGTPGWTDGRVSLQPQERLSTDTRFESHPDKHWSFRKELWRLLQGLQFNLSPVSPGRYWSSDEG